MRSLRRRAEHAGADLSEPEAAVALDASGDEAIVRTDRGRTIRAATVVVSAGPWLGGLVAGTGLVLPLAPAVARVTRRGSRRRAPPAGTERDRPSRDARRRGGSHGAYRALKLQRAHMRRGRAFGAAPTTPLR